MTEHAYVSKLLFVLPITFSLSNTVLLVVSIVCAYVIASTLYNLILHPLAGVPGPKLCAISRFPYWHAYFQGTDVSWLHQLHLRHGPVVRFGPSDLSYATAGAWKDIHGFHDGKKENEKAAEFSVQPVNGEFHLIRFLVHY